jgi:hypothetical protein
MDLLQDATAENSPSYTMGFVTSTNESSYPQVGPSTNEISRSRMSLAAVLSDTIAPELNQQDYKTGKEGLAVLEINKPNHLLTTFLSKEPLNERLVASIANCMRSLAFPPCWCSNPKLYYLLHKMKRVDLLYKILDADVTDLWLPLHKRLVRRWLNDAETKTFVRLQELVLNDNIPMNLQGQHFTLESMDQLDLDRVEHLGAGGFGDVWHVQNRSDGKTYACKTMARPVKYDSHAVLMQNFKREIMGMSRVRHRHCVDLVASCTDMDSVTILSSPVADLDLADFLNADLSADQLMTLWQSIGCITSALAYLHRLKIR